MENYSDNKSYKTNFKFFITLSYLVFNEPTYPYEFFERKLEMCLYPKSKKPIFLHRNSEKKDNPFNYVFKKLCEENCLKQTEDKYYEITEHGKKYLFTKLIKNLTYDEKKVIIKMYPELYKLEKNKLICINPDFDKYFIKPEQSAIKSTSSENTQSSIPAEIEESDEIEFINETDDLNDDDSIEQYNNQTNNTDYQNFTTENQEENSILANNDTISKKSDDSVEEISSGGYCPPDENINIIINQISDEQNLNLSDNINDNLNISDTELTSNDNISDDKSNGISFKQEENESEYNELFTETQHSDFYNNIVSKINSDSDEITDNKSENTESENLTTSEYEENFNPVKILSDTKNIESESFENIVSNESEPIISDIKEKNSIINTDAEKTENYLADNANLLSNDIDNHDNNSEQIELINNQLNKNNYTEKNNIIDSDEKNSESLNQNDGIRNTDTQTTTSQYNYKPTEDTNLTNSGSDKQNKVQQETVQSGTEKSKIKSVDNEKNKNNDDDAKLQRKFYNTEYRKNIAYSFYNVNKTNLIVSSYFLVIAMLFQLISHFIFGNTISPIIYTIEYCAIVIQFLYSLLCYLLRKHKKKEKNNNILKNIFISSIPIIILIILAIFALLNDFGLMVFQPVFIFAVILSVPLVNNFVVNIETKKEI